MVFVLCRFANVCLFSVYLFIYFNVFMGMFSEKGWTIFNIYNPKWFILFWCEGRVLARFTSLCGPNVRLQVSAARVCATLACFHFARLDSPERWLFYLKHNKSFRLLATRNVKLVLWQLRCSKMKCKNKSIFLVLVIRLLVSKALL